VVRKAAIYTSEDSALIPHVQMGVEAREQIRTDRGMVDAPITRPDHPLVKYAEMFSERFDLIAERKSVIHHLREVVVLSAIMEWYFFADAGLPVTRIWYVFALCVLHESGRGRYFATAEGHHGRVSTFAQHQDTLGGSGHRDTLGDPTHLGTWAPIVGSL